MEVPVQPPLPNQPCGVAVSRQDRGHCRGSVREHGGGVARLEVPSVVASHEGAARRRADGVASVGISELHALGTQPRNVRREEPLPPPVSLSLPCLSCLSVALGAQRVGVCGDVAVTEVILTRTHTEEEAREPSVRSLEKWRWKNTAQSALRVCGTATRRAASRVCARARVFAQCTSAQRGCQVSLRTYRQDEENVWRCTVTRRGSSRQRQHTGGRKAAHHSHSPTGRTSRSRDLQGDCPLRT